MEKTIDVDRHVGVGPCTDVYGHGPVTLIGSTLVVCQDCGYLTDDLRKLQGIECDREKNELNITWREKLSDESYPQ